MTAKDFLYALSQIPSDALEELLNCILIGVKKHGADTMADSDRVIELECIWRHFKALEVGYTHDKDDGQHHAAAIAVRCLKIIALDGKSARL
jgi:hypothetical protein